MVKQNKIMKSPCKQHGLFILYNFRYLLFIISYLCFGLCSLWLSGILQGTEVYSILNLTGLVVGITTSLLVLIWVVDELNQDRYHPDTERVFMVLRDVTLQDGQKLIGETTLAH